jgi:hypothetical protein
MKKQQMTVRLLTAQHTALQAEIKACFGQEKARE